MGELHLVLCKPAVSNKKCGLLRETFPSSTECCRVDSVHYWLWLLMKLLCHVEKAEESVPKKAPKKVQDGVIQCLALPALSRETEVP